MNMKEKKISYTGVDAVLNSDDILEDILLRLQPETIPKLILVSKRWLHLICSSEFRRSYLSKWKPSFRLLGFFVCNFLYLGRPKDGMQRPFSEPALPLLSTCKEGDDLKDSGILKQLGYFIDSSKGIILSGRHPRTYYVWDPFTKQKHKLPEPNQFYKMLSVAFIVEDSVDEGVLCYKVIRARCDCKLKERDNVSIETYSSKTGAWKQTTLRCPTTLALCPRNVATVVGGIIHWFARWGSLAVYDPRFGDRHMSLIKLPAGELSHDHEEAVLGESSDGLLLYGQSNNYAMEIWVLEKEQGACSSSDLGKYRWILRWRIRFKLVWKKNPTLSLYFKELQILAFLPQNSESVFVRFGQNIYLCHLETLNLEPVRYQGRGTSVSWETSKVVPYFVPSWPQSSK